MGCGASVEEMGEKHVVAPIPAPPQKFPPQRYQRIGAGAPRNLPMVPPKVEGRQMMFSFASNGSNAATIPFVECPHVHLNPPRRPLTMKMGGSRGTGTRFQLFSSPPYESGGPVREIPTSPPYVLRKFSELDVQLPWPMRRSRVITGENPTVASHVDPTAQQLQIGSTKFRTTDELTHGRVFVYLKGDTVPLGEVQLPLNGRMSFLKLRNSIRKCGLLLTDHFRFRSCRRELEESCLVPLAVWPPSLIHWFSTQRTPLAENDAIVVICFEDTPRYHVHLMHSIDIVLAWFEAVENKSIAAMETLYKNSHQLVYARDFAGRTALHVAVNSEDTQLAREVLRFGVPLDARDQSGCTALHNAVKHKDDAVLLMLLHQCPTLGDADRISQFINCADLNGWTPLMVALHQAMRAKGRGRFDTAAKALKVSETLLRFGADPWIVQHRTNYCAHHLAVRAYSSLMDAVTLKDYRRLESLLELNCSAEERLLTQNLSLLDGFSNAVTLTPNGGFCINSAGLTALHVAVSGGDMESATLILNSIKANPLTRGTLDAPNKQGETPVLLAVRIGDPGMLSLLMKEGADLYGCRTMSGRNIFHYCLGSRRGTRCLMTLLSDPNARFELLMEADMDGIVPLQLSFSPSRKLEESQICHLLTLVNDAAGRQSPIRGHPAPTPLQTTTPDIKVRSRFAKGLVTPREREMTNLSFDSNADVTDNDGTKGVVPNRALFLRRQAAWTAKRQAAMTSAAPTKEELFRRFMVLALTFNYGSVLQWLANQCWPSLFSPAALNENELLGIRFDQTAMENGAYAVERDLDLYRSILSGMEGVVNPRFWDYVRSYHYFGASNGSWNTVPRYKSLPIYVCERSKPAAEKFLKAFLRDFSIDRGSDAELCRQFFCDPLFRPLMRTLCLEATLPVAKAGLSGRASSELAHVPLWRRICVGQSGAITGLGISFCSDFLFQFFEIKPSMVDECHGFTAQEKILIASSLLRYFVLCDSHLSKDSQSSVVEFIFETLTNASCEFSVLSGEQLRRLPVIPCTTWLKPKRLENWPLLETLFARLWELASIPPTDPWFLIGTMCGAYTFVSKSIAESSGLPAAEVRQSFLCMLDSATACIHLATDAAAKGWWTWEILLKAVIYGYAPRTAHRTRYYPATEVLDHLAPLISLSVEEAHSIPERLITSALFRWARNSRPTQWATTMLKAFLPFVGTALGQNLTSASPGDNSTSAGGDAKEGQPPSPHRLASVFAFVAVHRYDADFMKGIPNALIPLLVRRALIVDNPQVLTRYVNSPEDYALFSGSLAQPLIHIACINKSSKCLIAMLRHVDRSHVVQSHSYLSRPKRNPSSTRLLPITRGSKDRKVLHQRSSPDSTASAAAGQGSQLINAVEICIALQWKEGMDAIRNHYFSGASDKSGTSSTHTPLPLSRHISEENAQVFKLMFEPSVLALSWFGFAYISNGSPNPLTHALPNPMRLRVMAFNSTAAFLQAVAFMQKVDTLVLWIESHPSIRNVLGEALQIVIRKNFRIRLIRTLLEENADPNWRLSPSYPTTLHYAVRRRSVMAVELLLRHGADPNVPLRVNQIKESLLSKSGSGTALTAATGPLRGNGGGMKRNSSSLSSTASTTGKPLGGRGHPSAAAVAAVAAPILQTLEILPLHEAFALRDVAIVELLGPVTKFPPPPCFTTWDVRLWYLCINQLHSKLSGAAYSNNSNSSLSIDALKMKDLLQTVTGYCLTPSIHETIPSLRTLFPSAGEFSVKTGSEELQPVNEGNGAGAEGESAVLEEGKSSPPPPATAASVDGQQGLGKQPRGNSPEIAQANVSVPAILHVQGRECWYVGSGGLRQFKELPVQLLDSSIHRLADLQL